jgi:PhnB protein
MIHTDNEDTDEARHLSQLQRQCSAYRSLRVNSDKEADRIYALPSHKGQIFMKMEETFLASRFAMVRDRFGTSWMLLRERERNAESP